MKLIRKTEFTIRKIDLLRNGQINLHENARNHFKVQNYNESKLLFH